MFNAPDECDRDRLNEEGVDMPDIPPPSIRSRVGEARRIRSTEEDDIEGSDVFKRPVLFSI